MITAGSRPGSDLSLNPAPYVTLKVQFSPQFPQLSSFYFASFSQDLKKNFSGKASNSACIIICVYVHLSYTYIIYHHRKAGN